MIMDVSVPILTVDGRMNVGVGAEASRCTA